MLQLMKLNEMYIIRNINLTKQIIILKHFSIKNYTILFINISLHNNKPDKLHIIMSVD